MLLHGSFTLRPFPITSTIRITSCFSDDTDEGSQVKQAILNILGRLGVPVASHKVEAPSSSLTFLGVLIDAVCYELRLPLDKLEQLRLMVDDWYTRPHRRRREMESFLGYLSHAATVIRPGQTFLQELFSRLRIIQNPLRLNMAARALGGGRFFFNIGMESHFNHSLPVHGQCSLMHQDHLLLGATLRNVVGSSTSGHLPSRSRVLQLRNFYLWFLQQLSGAHSGVGQRFFFF